LDSTTAAQAFILAAMKEQNQKESVVHENHTISSAKAVTSRAHAQQTLPRAQALA
jgi:hypothetical protein